MDALQVTGRGHFVLECLEPCLCGMRKLEWSSVPETERRRSMTSWPQTNKYSLISTGLSKLKAGRHSRADRTTSL